MSPGVFLYLKYWRGLYMEGISYFHEMLVAPERAPSAFRLDISPFLLFI